MFVRLDTDFKNYTKIKLDNLDLSYVVVEQPYSRGYPHWRHWELTEKDRLKLTELYRTAMLRQLQEQGGYEVAETDGEGVMTIKVYLLEIAPNAPKDDLRSFGVRGKVISQGAGSATIAFELYDAASGNILAAGKDRRDAGNSWGANNRFNNLQDVRQLFNTWARLLRKHLDHVHGKGS